MKDTLYNPAANMPRKTGAENGSTFCLVPKDVNRTHYQKVQLDTDGHGVNFKQKGVVLAPKARQKFAFCLALSARKSTNNFEKGKIL